MRRLLAPELESKEVSNGSESIFSLDKSADTQFEPSIDPSIALVVSCVVALSSLATFEQVLVSIGTIGPIDGSLKRERFAIRSLDPDIDPAIRHPTRYDAAGMDRRA